MNKCLDLYGCVKKTQFQGTLLQPTDQGNGSSLSDILARAAQPRIHLHQGTVQCAESDSVGELFVTGDDLGIVSVHYMSQVVRSNRDDRRELQSSEAALSIQTQVRSKVTAVRWNPGNQDEIAVMHQVPKSVYFYWIALVSVCVHKGVPTFFFRGHTIVRGEPYHH